MKKVGESSKLERMKIVPFNSTKDGKLHPVISIISANIFLGLFLNLVIKYSADPLQLYVFSIIIIIFSGYIANYFSWSNKALIGLYNSLLFSVLSLLVIIFIFKTGLTLNTILFLFIILPISGYIGGYIGKLSKKRNYGK